LLILVGEGGQCRTGFDSCVYNGLWLEKKKKMTMKTLVIKRGSSTLKEKEVGVDLNHGYVQ